MGMSNMHHALQNAPTAAATLEKNASNKNEKQKKK